MTFAAIITGIFSVAKSVPVIAEFLKELNEKYIDIQIEKANEYLATKENKRHFLMKQIREAKTDEELISLSVILSDINKL